MNPIHISNDRQLFWDDYLLNTSRTSAELRLHSPRREEIVFTFDAPWEGDGCTYFNIVRVGELYRMYYLGWNMLKTEATAHYLDGIRVCCIESKDGLHWYRPDLGLVECLGSKNNNVLMGPEHARFDNFFVFEDTNPACKPEERYKATSIANQEEGELYSFWAYTSPDGIHWKRSHPISDKAHFDTLNVALWDETREEYRIYCRGFHDVPDGNLNAGVRDIRIITSKDFVNWSDPIPMDFGNAEDIPLYTNMVSRYPRAKQMYVGYPTRYVERQEWTDNYDQLPGLERRKNRSLTSPRYGLAVTDCVLMTSRDGYHWKRRDEAWIAPGIEWDNNWVYGDGSSAPGSICTRSSLPGAPEELSVFCNEGHWSQKPKQLRRYTIRQDGYLSYHAGRPERVLTTKPLLYEGGELSINFSTSAIGYVYVTAKCGKEEIHSCEIFGDTLDRKVHFDGDLSAWVGKEIILEFRMSDADLYSMIFE